MRLLFLSSVNYLRQHPLQLLFSLLGISLGVAIAVAMDLSIHSAKQSFQLSVESLSGGATHRIIGHGAVVPEDIYRRLRVELGLKRVSPLIKSDILISSSTADKTAQKTRHRAQLIGIDSFSEGGMRNISRDDFNEISQQDIQRLLIEPNTVLVSEPFLREHGFSIGDQIGAEIDGRKILLRIIALYSVKDSLRHELKNWLISDISTAQEVSAMSGHLSAIDLILSGNIPKQLQQIEAILPSQVRIVEAQSQHKALSKLSESFELNLKALSLLGILVAMFLIYNTSMFSVVQRRNIFARMRVMGVTRQELFRIILLEALIIGIAATLIGLLLGIGLAKSLLGVVGQTMSDHYYRVQVSQLYWQQISMIKPLILGIGATLIAAAFPAWEAASTAPVKVLQRYDLEQKTIRWLNRLLIPGALGCVWVIYLFMDTQGSVVSGFMAVFVFIISFALILPWIIRHSLAGFNRVMKQLFSLPGKMAVKNIDRSLSRSMIAIIALTIAVSATLAIGIMIQSFRLTVDEWLAGFLRADYFVTPVNEQSRDLPMPDDLKQKIASIPQVKTVSFSRWRKFSIDGADHQLIVLDMPAQSFAAFRFKTGNSQQAQQAWQGGDAVIISEPYAYRHQLKLGDWIHLPVQYSQKKGVKPHEATQAFKVVGVFYHYGSEQGTINMSRETYQKYWQDNKVNSLGIYMHSNADRDRFKQQLLKVLEGRNMHLYSKSELHQESLRIFDRTFRVTQVLKLLVVVVSFVGILSALMAIALERHREFAMLRVLGLTPGQLSALVYLETLTIGILAALMAVPMGTVLAYLLVEVINYRSFGWSMLFILPSSEYLYAMLLALISALAAAVYPAHRMARAQPALSLRGE